MDVEAALKVAVARLGVAELRDKQREAIESFVSGKDVFVAGMENLCATRSCLFYLTEIFANNPRYVINYVLFLLTHAGRTFRGDTGPIGI